jgi:hypothetical protein
VSHPTDEFITCHSCDFRYPQSRGVCVMCGEPARTTAPTQVSTDLRSASRPPKHLEGTIFGEPSQSIERQGRGKSVGIGIAVAVVVLVPVLLVLHNWQTSTSPSTGPVAAATSPQPQETFEKVTVPAPVMKSPAKKVRTPALPDPPEAAAIPAAQEDPAELWKGVRSGSARAEVTLAKLYLDGNSVPQSCEQTHMLLVAASKKGYKAADNILSGAYVDRCPSPSAR